MAERTHGAAHAPSDAGSDDPSEFGVEEDELLDDEHPEHRAHARAAPNVRARSAMDSERPEPRRSGIAPRRHVDSVLHLREGSLIGGRYRVESVLREDDSSLVSRVQHVELGTLANLRCLVTRADGRDAATSRFLREARAAAKAQNEHLVRVLDIGRMGDGTPFVVTEWLDGWTLEEVCRVRGTLPVQEAVEYVVQAGIGVAAVHAAGIVHGSLHLRSLILSRCLDGSPLVKVTGVGTAVALSFELSRGHKGGRDSESFARLAYLSPEQLRDDEAVDARADVFSLGAILYTLLSGLPPFRGGTPASVLASVAADPPTPLGMLRHDVAPELERAVMSCLEKDPARRTATVPELLESLRAFASGDAVALLERTASPGVSRPPPLPASVRDAAPVPLTMPRQRSIVPMKRAPEPAPALVPSGYVARAASVGAGVGALVAVAFMVLIGAGARANDPRPLAPPVEAPVLPPVPPAAPLAASAVQAAPVAPLPAPPVVPHRPVLASAETRALNTAAASRRPERDTTTKVVESKPAEPAPRERAGAGDELFNDAR